MSELTPRPATEGELEAIAGAALALRSPSIARALEQAEAARPGIKVLDVVDEQGKPLREVPAGVHYRMEYDAATARLFMIRSGVNRAARRAAAGRKARGGR